MLETIKELLKGNAKILLTTRKTAIFSDDDFHQWIDRNVDNFNCKRYSISTPSVADWIDPTREKMLAKAGLNMKSISNPVLLSYLRSLTFEKFEKTLNNIDSIIEDYIELLMKREITRQELRMTVAQQTKVLEIISGYFIDHDITSDTKEALENILTTPQASFLISILESYPPEARITLDQLIQKLIMHAFLDRKGEDERRIGFVNDFMLGTFAGLNLINNRTGWICTERFIDFLLTAYIPRSQDKKQEIYQLLKENMFSYLNTQKIIYIDNYLGGGIRHDINGEFVEDFEFRTNLSIESKITDCVFYSCVFYDITIDFILLERVHFINCEFYNCQIQSKESASDLITFNNCKSDPDFLSAINIEIDDRRDMKNDEIDKYERHVLERFWPAGKERFGVFKRIGTLRLGVPAEEIARVDDAIGSLIKREIIIEARGKFSVQLNIHHIVEIKKILGRA